MIFGPSVGLLGLPLEMKAQLIRIAKNQTLEILICKTGAAHCDGKRTGLRTNIFLRGPLTISLVKTKKGAIRG